VNEIWHLTILSTIQHPASSIQYPENPTFVKHSKPSMTFQKIIVTALLFFFLAGTITSQNTLFDDTRLSSIYISIPADSLAVIYDSVLSDHYFMARFIFDDTQKKDTLENIGFRLRGNTSRYSQKKSFKISFSEYVSERKYQGVKKINLNGEHNDPTMIREKLFYDLWKKSGMVERRTSFVKVYINDKYYGLYTNLEEMEKEWLTLVYPDNGGNLYKCTYPADLVYLGNNQETYKNLENSTATGGRVYELQTNKPEDDYSRLVDLITLLNKKPDAQFEVSLPQILNVDLFLKSLALDVATGNWDDYGYNKNNYYLYDNPYDNRFHFITYDPDNTSGIDWFGIDWGVRDCRNWINKRISLPLAQKVLAVPAFYNRYIFYLDTIARFIIHPDSVFPSIDSFKQLIQIAAEEDTFRTMDYGYTIDDFNDSFTKSLGAHTKYGLKPFFETRMQSILNQLDAIGIDENDPGIADVKIFPNPAENYLILSLDHVSSRPVKATITDIFGKVQDEFIVNNINISQLTVPVHKLVPGLYFLFIESYGKLYKLKFIKK
jgi:hypothetical protein